MAVPTSGAISLAKIRDEFENDNYNNSLYGYTSASTSLAGLWTGTYGAINTNSTYPGVSTTHASVSGQPHEMSEFYAYDHDAAPAFSWGTSQGIGANMFNVNMSTDDGSRGQSGTVIKISHSSGQVNYQVVDIVKSSPQTGSFYGNGADTTRSVSYTGTLSALYIQFIFTSIDIDEEHESAPGQLAAEIRKHTTAHVTHPDYTGYSLVQTLSAGTNQNITGTITQIGHTGSSSYFVMLETGSTGPDDRDQIIMHNGTVACKLYANSTTGSSVTLFTGDAVDIEAGSSDDSS